MKKVKLLGRSIPILAIVAIAASAGMASAALLSYYGRITGTVGVKQSVLVDGKSYLDPITYSSNIVAGSSVVSAHTLHNQAEVQAKVRLVTNITAVDTDGKWMDPEGVTTSYRKFEVTQNSGQNEINKEAGHPYINWTIDGNEITFEFVNPTNFQFAFDYRVDGESGTRGEWASTVISGGELDGQEIGPSYNVVNVDVGAPITVTVTASKEVWVGLRLGAENDWYLNWIVFKLLELPAPITLEPGERLDFCIVNEFAIDIRPGTYTITTTVVPE